jgi:predicted permease
MFEKVLSTLVQVSVPLSLPVLSGVILSRWKKFETKQLLTVVLYALSPGIIFHTLSTAQVTLNDVTVSGLFSLVNLGLLWAIAKVLAKVTRLPAPETAELTLIAMMTNSVNYGLPLVLLAFGQLGLDKAAELDQTSVKAFWAGISTRMLVAPLLAFFILTILGTGGILRSVLFIEASMPVAVNSVILAEKFEAAPKFVSRCILWTTLASFITLPILIALVGSY